MVSSTRIFKFCHKSVEKLDYPQLFRTIKVDLILMARDSYVGGEPNTITTD